MSDPNASPGHVITVVDPGLLSTLQDAGRAGNAHLGVSPSGAMDRAAATAANGVVGNVIDAPCLESTFDGCSLRFEADCVIAVTGAPAAVTCSDPRARPTTGRAFRVRSGSALHIRVLEGMRTYLAVRGGLQPAGSPQLGSYSTDLLSGLGPPALTAGTALFRAEVPTQTPADPPVTQHGAPSPLVLPVMLGPRDDELSPAGYRTFLTSTFTVIAESNRVGLRLSGPRVERRNADELPSEGVVTGAVQVPPQGTPVVFGPDHPTTGGYPVVAVVRERALDLLAQLRPGTHLRFTRG